MRVRIGLAEDVHDPVEDVDDARHVDVLVGNKDCLGEEINGEDEDRARIVLEVSILVRVLEFVAGVEPTMEYLRDFWKLRDCSAALSIIFAASMAVRTS